MFKALRAAGLDVRVATPFRVRRGNKADFNDLAQERGLDAVRARIDMVAIDYEPFEELVISVQDARKQLDARVGEFFHLVEARAPEEVMAGAPADETTDSSEETIDFSKASPFGNRPPAHAAGVTVGVGKTEAALRHTLRKLIEMREIGDERAIVFALPEHELSAKVAARFNKMAKDAGVDLRAGVWRGRDAKLPNSTTGEKMCAEIEMMRLALKLHADVDKEVCSVCEHSKTCAYLAQRGHDADLWIVAHQIIFYQPPAPIEGRGVAALVVDESPWRAGLIGTEGEGVEIELNSLSLMAIPSGDYGRKLAKIRATLEFALREEKEGPVRREALVAAGLTYRDAHFAEIIEWTRKEYDGKWWDRKENATLTPMVALWKAVAFALLDDGAEASGRMTLEVSRQDRVPRKVIRIFGVKDISSAWLAPTLLIDATLDINLVSPFWRNVEDKGRLDVSAPHQFVRQATSKSWALSSLIAKDETENEVGASSPTSDEDIKEAAKAARDAAKQRTTAENNLRKARTTIMTRAREIGGKTLVISNKAVINALVLPAHIQTGHFNAIAGRDDWGDVDLLVVIGRPMPPPKAVERMAGAINGDAPATVEGWYQRADAFRLQRVSDRLVVPVLAESDFHPDETCERIRQRICVGEIIQAIGRARGVNRGPDNPVEI